MAPNMSIFDSDSSAWRGGVPLRRLTKKTTPPAVRTALADAGVERTRGQHDRLGSRFNGPVELVVDGLSSEAVDDAVMQFLEGHVDRVTLVPYDSEGLSDHDSQFASTEYTGKYDDDNDSDSVR